MPNADGKLLSGMYADVALDLKAPRQVFEIPATALLSDAQGLRVAIVKPDDTLHLQPVTIDRDLGAPPRDLDRIDRRRAPGSGGERRSGRGPALVQAVAAKAPAAPPSASGKSSTP